MDSSDPSIFFDSDGVCNHCHEYDYFIKNHVFSGYEGKKKLESIVKKIKDDGKKQEYNCTLGISGGVDSSFVAYKIKELGLRPLAVHLDNGWNSEIAVRNIQKSLDKLDIDLFTYVIEWNEFRDLQLSFLKASTPDSEIPTDHAITSLMYKISKEKKLKHLITGMNFKTETHIPAAWSQGEYDWKYINNVHKKFGSVPLKTFPHHTIYKEWYYRKTINRVNPLNYIDYCKTDAIEILERELGWQYYGGKHYESIYTRFFQGYILPKKFGYDKRRGHLSSLICSGEITREDALKELLNEPYPFEMQMDDKSYIIEKLGISEEDFETLMHLPKKTIYDYPSNARDWHIRILKNGKKLIKKIFLNKNI